MRIKRKLAVLLMGVMVVTSINISPITAFASDAASAVNNTSGSTKLTLTINHDTDQDTNKDTDKGASDITASFAALKLKGEGGINSVKLSWSKIKEADGYILYGAKCGKKMTKLKDVTSLKKTYTVKKLKKGTYYKFRVAAYKNVNGEKQIIKKSMTIHVATKGGKYGNPTAVTYTKNKLSIKTGKSFTLKAKLKTNKKIKIHVTKFRYESTDSNVASVNSKGVIKAKKKGTCTIYIYAQNGLYKKVKVTVK